jgi:hypothetical protein
MNSKLLFLIFIWLPLGGLGGLAHGQSPAPAHSATPPLTACPQPQEVTARHLYGTWTATLSAAHAQAAPAGSVASRQTSPASPVTAQWTLELGRHDEFTDGVFGRLAHSKTTPTLGQPISGLVSPAGVSPMDNNGNTRSTPNTPLAELQLLVAGDVDDGVLTLEESADGTTIAATWLGEVVPGSCGKTIQGQWSSSASPVRLQFQLVKQATW